MDTGYTDYTSKDDLFEAEWIYAKVYRKKKSKRSDELYVSFLKAYVHKEIKTDFTQIKAKMLCTFMP